MSLSDPDLINFAGCPTVVVRREDLPLEELVDFMDESFTALGEAIRDGLFRPAGPGFTRYDTPVRESTTLEVGFPVDEPWERFAKVGETTIQGSTLPQGLTAVGKLKGDLAEISHAWQEMLSRVADRGYTTKRPFWEYYDVPPMPGRETRHQLTRLCVPVKR